jgi:uncharacterized protein (DUF697 family)
MDKFKELFGKVGAFVKTNKNVVIPVAVAVAGALIGGAIAAVVVRNEGFILEEIDRMSEVALNIDGTPVDEDNEEVEE